LAFAKARLRPGGQMLGTVNLGERASEVWQEFPVNWRPLSFYQSLAAQAGLKAEDLGTLAGLLGVPPQANEQNLLRFTHL
jgi:hypothetical protein